MLQGPDIERVSVDGRQDAVAYSVAFLQEAGNVWVQDHATTKWDAWKIAFQPTSIVYDDRTGNVIVDLGIQSVVVGTPDGGWRPSRRSW